MAADVSWNNDSDASNDTGGYTIGFSLNVLQVFHLMAPFLCFDLMLLKKL